MSATNTSSASAGASRQPELPAVLIGFIQAIKPSIYLLLVSAVWLGIAVPLMVVLFYTSTKKLRRSAIFISNAIGISIGITMGVLSAAIQTNAILDPINGLSRRNLIAYVTLACLGGLYVDCVLLFRVFVVFPRTTTPQRLWYSIITPLVLLKIARFINVIIFLTQYFGTSSKSNVNGPLDPHYVEEIVEWSLQLVDNSICSSLFLWQLNRAQGFWRGIRPTLKSKSSYHRALGTLFWIAATNFVFPCAFDILMFVLYFRDPTGITYPIVFASNVYVQIIGVLFATVWRATHESSMTTVEISIMPQTQELKIEFAHSRDVQSQNASASADNHSNSELKRTQGEPDIEEQ